MSIFLLRISIQILLGGLVTSMLVACGGSSSTQINGVSTVVAIKGTAAVGKAIDGATVIAKCVSGTSTTRTSGDGTFVLTVSGGVLPCVLQETNPIDGTKLHSVIAGHNMIVSANITPLTEMMTARVLGNEPATFFVNFDPAFAASAVNVDAVKAAQFDVVVALAGVANLGQISDIISSPLIAATANNPNGGDAHDKLLDVISSKLSPTQLSLVVSALAHSANTLGTQAMVSDYASVTQARLNSVLNLSTQMQLVFWNDSFPAGTNYLIEVQNVDGSFSTVQAFSGLGGKGALMQWQPPAMQMASYRIRAVMTDRSIVLMSPQGNSTISVPVNAIPPTPLIIQPTGAISKWKGNADSAMSFVWDDNNHIQYEVIAPIFEKYGYRASFALVTGWLNAADIVGYQSILNKGHELCSHTQNHLTFDSLNEVQMRDQLALSKQTLISTFGVIPRAVIHPGNRLNPTLDVVGDYYLYSRISNPFQDVGNSVANMSTGFDLVRFNSALTYITIHKSWVTFAGHGVDGFGYQPISSKDLDDFLSSLKNTSVWLDTYSNVALYNEVRLSLGAITFLNQQAVIDDSKVAYAKFASFGITNIPVTIAISSPNEMIFTGANIMEVKHQGTQYFVTINLVNGNVVNWDWAVPN